MDAEKSARQRYLDAVAARLRMPDDERAAVVREVADHLEDAVTELLGAGRTLEDAEREALRRLGPPTRLGDALRKSHQTTRRLLAAVGGGLWQGLNGAVSGYFSTLLSLLGIAMAVGAVALLITTAANISISRGIDRELSAAAGAIVLSGAAWTAGRRTVIGFSTRSLHTPRHASGPIAAIGVAVLSLLVIFLPADRTWLSVGMACAMPIAFGVGALRAGDLGEGRTWIPARWPAWMPDVRATMLVLLFGGLGIGIAVGSANQRDLPQRAEGDAPMSAERWAALGYTAVAGSFVETEHQAARGFSVRGREIVRLGDLGVDWAAWSNVRVEAWQATEPEEIDGPHLLVEPAKGPYLRILVEDPAATSSIEVEVGQPGISSYLLFVIADDDTGRSTAIGAPAGDTTTFYGSLIEWFEAAARERPIREVVIGNDFRP